ncbi:ankyrin repeat protein [Thozetella sp. PMI_491]|nr:ankyrin repeat protein [Thozetella sp. PMI_491]
MADPLSIVGLGISIVEISSSLYDYISSVKAARDDIRRLSQELFALKGTLDQFLVFKQSDEKALQAPQMDGMVHLTREALDSIQKRLTRRKTKLGMAVQSLSWPFKKDEVDKLVQALERAKTWFILVIMQDSTETTEAIYSEMKRLANAIHEDIIARRLDRMMAETQETIQWLAPVEAQDAYQKANRDRAPGTGTWFFDKIYETWAGSSCKTPMLWITGKSGAGKTTLFSSIVEELRKQCSVSDGGWGCGFHYCSFDNSASQLPASVFGSMLAELARMRPEIIERIRPLMRQNASSNRGSLSISEITEFLISGLALVDQFFILVDALNETPHQLQIVPLLLSLCRMCPNVRVLVTCTAGPQAEYPELLVQRMSGVGVDHDIQVYVQRRLSTEPSFCALSDKIQGKIRQRMAEGANGTFRWAQLCMDRLSHLRTGRDMLAALSDLPSTLNETYSRTLQRVPESDKPLAREVLLWLAFSTRPMNLRQLGEAVVLQESDRYLDDDYRLTDPHTAIGICNGLAQVDGDIVTLAHDSIRTFLTSSWIQDSPSAFFALDAATCHRQIMRKCLAYLSFDVLASGHVQQQIQLLRRAKDHPLLDYAALFWPDHLADPPDPDDEALVLEFFATKANPKGGCFESWVQLLLFSTDIEAIEKTQPLYYASSYNLVPILKILLRPGSGVDVNHPGGRFGSTPLAIACYRGHSEAATLLLNAGADPDVRDEGIHTSAYSLAKHRKMWDVVALMESLGVRTDKQSRMAG